MSYTMMQPGDFMLVTRGRGYVPQQVDRAVGELVAVQQAAARRIVELEKELAGRARRLAQLREQALTTRPPAYDVLGEGARNLYRDAVVEARRLREQAAAAGRSQTEAARVAGEERRRAALRAAEELCAAADEAALEHVRQARLTAVRLVGEARLQAAAMREEGRRRAEDTTWETAEFVAGQQVALAEREKREEGRALARLRAVDEALAAAEVRAEADRSAAVRRRDEAAARAAVLLERAGQEAADLRDRAWQAAHRIECAAAREQERFAARIAAARARLDAVRNSLASIAAHHDQADTPPADAR
ncbi:hypothetical protein ACXZ65_01310 [Streptomyces aculeolatus]